MFEFVLKDWIKLTLDSAMVSVSRASARSYSGLKAASMAVAAAASNIAGINATATLEDAKIQPVDPSQKPGEQQGQGGYRPLRVEQQSLAHGGVGARYGAISPAYVVAFNPADLNADGEGLLAVPNVDVAAELINLGVAQRAYQASLKVIEVEEEMSGSLLDALK